MQTNPKWAHTKGRKREFIYRVKHADEGKKLIFMSINQLVVDCPFEKDESDDREKGTAHWRGY